MRRILAVVAVSAALLCGCGGSSKSTASSAASTACGQVLSIAAAIADNYRITTAAAAGVLRGADANAQSAMRADPHDFTALAHAVHNIRYDVESGQKATLRSNLEVLASSCAHVEAPVAVTTT